MCEVNGCTFSPEDCTHKNVRYERSECGFCGGQDAFCEGCGATMCGCRALLGVNGSDPGGASSASVGPSATEGAKGPQIFALASERTDVLYRFIAELEKATKDGSRKRQSGSKPPWYRDDSHEGAIFSHITKWKRGELVDPDSGAHPLVHAAWRCLAIACRESGNVPTETTST